LSVSFFLLFLVIKLKFCNVPSSAEHPDDYELITRTDAKKEFLLKDCDFDFREPMLKYIVKKNPHNKRWGEMKLYLKFQCRDRAITVHESEENLEDKKEIRVINLQKTRQKNYVNKIKGRNYMKQHNFM
jgi:DNA-repair protein complementing XP-A cells